MDRVPSGYLDFAFLVDRAPEYVEDAAERPRSDRHEDRRASRFRRKPALEAVGGIHCHRADPVVAEVFLNLEHERLFVGPRHLNGFIQFRDLPFWELDVDHTAKDLYYTAGCICHELIPPILCRQPARLSSG